MNPESDIDLHSLHLLRQVAEFRGFSAASRSCGLSQSALTRQVQSIEAKLGIKVFERTTRSVTITEAGAVFLRETEAIPGILGGAIRRIQEDYLGARREIHVGISKDLSLSHIPGIFHSHAKTHPEVRLVVSQPDEEDLLQRVGASVLDLGILTLPSRLPSDIRISHRMEDPLCVIASSQTEPPTVKSLPAFRKWAGSQNWLLPRRLSRCRGLIDEWALTRNLDLPSQMELENFDMMVPFVSMGMGVALVPRRCLSSFRRKRHIRQIHTPVKLLRQLVVVSPRHARCPEHVSLFVDGILFS